MRIQLKSPDYANDGTWAASVFSPRFKKVCNTRLPSVQGSDRPEKTAET